MSSRREEKERRRAERLAAEQEAERADARRRRLGIALGAALGVAAVAAVVIAVAGGRGGGDGKTGATTPTVPKVPIPPPKTADLQAAASAAGCRLRTFLPGPRDREHVTVAVPYKQNPPVFGPHNPTWAHDGSYAGQAAPSTEMVVHAMEHGRVIIWYRPSVGQRAIGQLETLFSEPFSGQPSGYKQLLVQRPDMPFAVAATSWGQQLGCPRFDAGVFDALRAFRARYVDRGPEPVPFPS